MAALHCPFAENQFLNLGLELRSNGGSNRWRSVKHETKLLNFESSHGPHPRTIASIWHDMQTMSPVPINDEVTPERLLLVCRWFKECESEEDLHTHHGHGEATIRSWCKNIPDFIAAP